MTFRSDDLLYALTQATKQVDVHPEAPQWHEVACSQAINMEQSRLINVELRRERDEAVADREAALDLAARYARAAGIAEPDRDAALRYVQTYRDQWDCGQRQAEQLEGQRFATLQLAWQLQGLAGGSCRFTGDVAALAKVVSAELSRINTAQGGSRTVKLALPEVPQQAELSLADALPVQTADTGENGGAE